MKFSYNGKTQAFYAFIKKEFYHITRDVRTMMILLLTPIVQILLFGFALNTEVNNVKFAVLDLSRDDLSKSITHAFAESNYFDFIEYIDSKKQLETIFNTNVIDMALVFGHDFGRTQQVQIILDASDPNRANIANMYALNIISHTMTQYTHIHLQTPIIPLTTMLFNPQGKSAYNFVPGLLGMILMLICAMMTSISIVREKEQGSMEIVLVSPVKPIFMIVAKIIPYFVISCVSLVAVLLVCVFALELKIAGNLVLLLGFCMLYIALTLSIGLLVSNIAQTQIVAMLVCGVLFMMPIITLSGMLFPTESMPLILQYVSHIIPTKWFIIGVKKIMIAGLGFSYVIKETCILCAMLFIILLVSLKTFKMRLA